MPRGKKFTAEQIIGKLRVPEDVAIIGVEGDLLVGQDSLCSITTIDPNDEELGYQGAALLDG